MLTPLRITNLPGAKGPSLALDAQGTIHVVFGAENTLYLASTSAGDSTFTTPVKIAQAGRLALGMRRGPRIAISGKALVVSAIYGQQGNGRDGELLVWRSTDGAASWQGPRDGE